MAAGNGYTVVIKNDGTLWAWGLNSSGQLGLGNNINQTTPQQVTTDDDWEYIAAGDYHTIAIKNNGTLWAWGLNNYGQLGLGSSAETSYNTPQQITGAGDSWKYVIAGDYHTIAIKNNGTLWAWGYNNVGQLGLGNNTSQTTPQQVTSAGDNWEYVAAGDYHIIAIKNNGTLWAWGLNTSGQLGLGNNTSQTTPQQVTGDSWKYVAAGSLHSIAIKNNGTLWAWGQNNFGQLGLGDDTNQTTPQQVTSAGDNWEYAAGGNYHNIAQKKNNTIYSWGNNQMGQLGLGDTVNRYTPIRLGEAADLIAVSAKGNHTAALRRSGILWTWGHNSNGQLGDGTTTNRHRPTAVKWP